MSIQLERRAWHVAGHAYAAMAFQFEPFWLTIEELPESIFAEAKGKTRIDEWVILERRETRPQGTLEHTTCMEGLMTVALCGPAAELRFCGEPCTAQRMQQFPWDWRNACETLSHIWTDEDDHSRMLERHVERAATFVGHARTLELIEAFASHLVKHGSMSGDESQALWNRVRSAQGSRSNRPSRAVVDDRVQEDWIDLSVNPE